MIDYASVAFALGYFYFFLRLLEEGGTLLTLAGTVICGTLGYLIKITTMPTVVFPLAYFIVKQLWNNYNKAGGGLLSYIVQEKIFIIKLLTAIVLPFAAGYLWTIHADNVKKASLFTEWLTSEHLEGWNYGTWQQRGQWRIWMAIFGYIKPFMPFTLFLVPAGLVFVIKHPGRYMEFIYTSLLGTFMTVLIFFHLYMEHNYYSMAVTPFLAMTVGFAMYHILFVLLKNKKGTKALQLKGCIAAACLGLFIYFYIGTARGYLTYPLIINNYSASTIGDFLKVITPPDEYIIITDHLWNPSILYYSRRKGFMIDKDHDYGERMLTFLKEHKFTTIVTIRQYPELLSNWKYVLKIAPQGYRIAGYNIYKVTDDPEAYERYKKFNDFKVSNENK